MGLNSIFGKDVDVFLIKRFLDHSLYNAGPEQIFVDDFISSFICHHLQFVGE